MLKYMQVVFLYCIAFCGAFVVSCDMKCHAYLKCPSPGIIGNFGYVQESPLLIKRNTRACDRTPWCATCGCWENCLGRRVEIQRRRLRHVVCYSAGVRRALLGTGTVGLLESWCTNACLLCQSS